MNFSRNSLKRVWFPAAAFVPLLGLFSWIIWGEAPAPADCRLSFQPDAIVVLGGGDGARGREAYRLHQEYPEAALIVTGDGNQILEGLVRRGVPASRIIHETHAENTYQNARFTSPLLESVHANRVALVTDWFHVPRALAIFRKVQPDRRFQASFEPRPIQPPACEASHARRERLAILFYILRHGINPFSGWS